MLKIGNVSIKNPLVLAPMADITTISFRMMCKEYGAGLVVTEMVNSNSIARHNKATFKTANVVDGERPVAIQIFGQSNKSIVQAAQILEKDADIIDFNCGCPVPNIMSQGAGAALLKRPAKMKSIIEEASSTIKKPFTVKIRMGLTKGSSDTVKTAKLIENAGAAAITVHARTWDQGYSGKANWEVIKDVKKNVSIPVIGNGDVDSPQKCRQMLDSTGCDFVMIGRAALGNPYIFKQCSYYLEKGEILPAQTTQERLKDFIRLVEKSEKYQDIDFVRIKRRSIDFTKGFSGAARLREELNHCDDLRSVIGCLRRIKS